VRQILGEVAFSVGVAIPAGFLGFVLLFSDVSYGPVVMLAWLTFHFFLPGIIVGLVTPRTWFLSVLIAWPVIALEAMGAGLPIRLKILPPALALLGGLVGAGIRILRRRVRGRAAARSTMPPNV
jgi:hypothetical protein